MTFTPRQFYDLYGLPYVVEIVLAPAAYYDIPIDPDRYIVGIIKSNVDLCFECASEYAITPGQTNFTANQNPLIYTHALHGSMVGMHWRINNTDVILGNFISIVIGRMIDPARMLQELANAKNVQRVRASSRGNKRTSSTKKRA